MKAKKAFKEDKEEDIKSSSFFLNKRE